MRGLTARPAPVGFTSRSLTVPIRVLVAQVADSRLTRSAGCVDTMPTFIVTVLELTVDVSSVARRLAVSGITVPSTVWGRTSTRTLNVWDAPGASVNAGVLMTLPLTVNAVG